MTLKNKGSVIIVVGAPQTGKTTKIREICKKISPIGKGIGALDPYNEHIAELHVKNWETLERVALNCKGKTFIFEEATHYLTSHNRPEGMKKLITGAMGHFQHNLFFCYHDLSSIPTWIIPSINYIYYTKAMSKGSIPRPLDKIEQMGINGHYKWYKREFLI